MNNDRFLTRVWDKQEKRMLYQGAGFSHENATLEFRGVNNIGLIISETPCGVPQIKHVFYILPFRNLKDRFVPMQCSGRKDQNKKLIYTKDIVKICDGTDYSYHEIVRDLDYPAFDIFPLLYDDCNSLQAALTELFVEVVGNKFENPKLMEVKA